MENTSRVQEGAVEIKGPVPSSAATADDIRSASSSRRQRPPRRQSELLVGGGNTVRKLMRREVGGLSSRPPTRPDAVFCAEKFRRFKLQQEFLVRADMDFTPLMSRSIARIILANDMIFVIDSYGYCVAFHRTVNTSIAPYEKGGRIWYFNNNGHMVDLFYNKLNDSIITVCSSVSRTCYKMGAIPLESIRRCDDWGSGIPVFGSQTNKLPIFDTCNNLAVISSYHQHEHHYLTNIYEINNYQIVHSIPVEIHSITTRPGIMIVAYNNISNYLPIKVFSTENWMVLKEFSHPLPPRNRLQFAGLCYENLLVKEKYQNMHVIDVWNYGNMTTIENSEQETPSLSFDLIANNILLKFNNDNVITCNSRGEQMRLVEDDRNHSSYSTVHMSVVRDKKFAILYSRKHIENPGKGIYNRQPSYSGTINICSTINGKSIVEVNPCNKLDLKAAAHNDADNNRTNQVESSAQEALENVSALFYDEEHHVIYTGNTGGFIHVWST